MLDQLLASLPKTFIAIVVMVIGLLLIRQYDPPRTICDAQMELFRESQKKFLYPEPGSGMIKKSALVKTLFEHCKQNNSPGGCFEFFELLKKMSVDLSAVPEQCSEAVGEEEPIKKWLKESLKLMVLMAWGSKAPASYNLKRGWYDASELTLFCGLRRHVIRIYGQDDFAKWQEAILSSVPDADKLDRNQVWQRNLLSTPCDLYR